MVAADVAAVLALGEAYVAEAFAAGWFADCEVAEREEAWLMFGTRLEAAHSAGLAAVLVGEVPQPVIGFALALTGEHLPEIPAGSALISDVYLVPSERRASRGYELWRTLLQLVGDAGHAQVYANTHRERRRLTNVLRKLGMRTTTALPLPTERPARQAWFVKPIAS